ncbi:SapC family protein [Devosia sp. RR2S18]|uniref:SapC family protein n=1 Tax=Devosia rhizosphaerae TaxID=3049774 RepID=UPI00253FE65B|nr:SapC family protein [Devosia sp. RR2S18]WIJ24035.1 SapC family protein [Devosia sp. RR2S18]
MTNITPVTRERHARKTWKRNQNYLFAERAHVVLLAANELGHAAGALPIAFTAANGDIAPVAVLAFKPEQNLFVAPQGQWVGSYVPAALRSQPFLLGAASEDRLTLCLDEDSALVSDDGEGEPFFNEDGQPSEATKEMLNFLVASRNGQQAAKQMAGLLHEHGVLEDWPIKLQEGGAQRDVTGLLRVSETSLNKLSDESFLVLRRGGALALAYAQLLSMQNMSMLTRLAQAHKNHRQQNKKRQQDQASFFKPQDDDLEEKIDWDAILKD